MFLLSSCTISKSELMQYDKRDLQISLYHMKHIIHSITNIMHRILNFKFFIIFYFLAKNLKILKTHQVTFKGCFSIYKQYKYTSFIYLWYNGDLVPQFMEANLLCIHIVYYYGAVDFGHSKHQADQGAFASPCTSHQSNLQHFSE